jgi:hypothetical protein
MLLGVTNLLLLTLLTILDGLRSERVMTRPHLLAFEEFGATATVGEVATVATAGVGIGKVFPAVLATFFHDDEEGRVGLALVLVNLGAW